MLSWIRVILLIWLSCSATGRKIWTVFAQRTCTVRHTCMFTCIDVNWFHPHTFMHGQTHWNMQRQHHAKVSHKQQAHNCCYWSLSDCQRCFPIKRLSAASGTVQSYYVPATCNSVFQYEHNDRSILNTPTISVWHLRLCIGWIVEFTIYYNLAFYVCSNFCK